MAAINITKEDFDALVLNADKPVLLDFWAPWCGPCRMSAPAVEEIAEENPQITVAKVNVSEEMDLAAQFGVASIPTFLLVKNGQVVKKSVGFSGKNALLSLLED